MAGSRRSHRSYVSYIDKSRDYYAAHGYEKAYEWAAHDEAPFTPLSKPLSKCKVGLITTSYFLPDGFVYQVPSDLPRVPHVADRSQVKNLDNQYLAWAKDETHTNDSETFLPLARLDEFAKSGRIGAVSERFYSLPTQFSHRQTERRDTPQVLEWLTEDEVDVVMMVPL